ncbi:MAG: T9SS type A sorting domain-containing protein [Bacteroidia bacterium]|nr:T9SS type A sorting domain-containing protein [Bacteroidia bacterium]
MISRSQPMYDYSWRYYTTGNTGIMGDYSEAIWIDHDGDPYIAAYTPGWEEGGFSKYIQANNQWINYSNVEYPVIGSIYDVGASRINEIFEDTNGILWMATWRGFLKFDPAVGGSSIQFWGANNSIHPGGRTMDIDIAPDGSVWAAVFSVTWGFGGLVHYDPATNVWKLWSYGTTQDNWPSLIGTCEKLSIQVKPGGGYVVWIDGEGWNTMISYDSDTQVFTSLPQNGTAGEVVALPGNDCTDNEGNLWALRFTTPGSPFSLDYRKPDGTWVSPSQPAAVSDIWVFKAFGNHEALLIDGNSNVFQFDGTTWHHKGIWRQGGFSSAVDIDSAGNIWASGIGGAAKRDALTGQWQRHRISNSSQIDYWVQDMSIDTAGNVWMTGNGGPGVGGFQKFDGQNWIPFNESNYGMGYGFPFPADNTQKIYRRPSNGDVIFNPTFNGIHGWNGNNFFELTGGSAVSKGLTEDSEGRLWNISEYFSVEYYDNNTWTPVDFLGWGANIVTDPTRSGTIWACSGYQALRTDGTYNFSKVVDDFLELDPQSDVLSTVMAAPDGIAWIGSNQGLFRVNANDNAYQFFSPANSAIPGENITPLAYTPDGRLWFTNFGSANATQIGLCWYDSTGFGIFPVEDGGLTHAQIADIEVKPLEKGYELWISCLSRGVAVLTVNDTTPTIGTAIGDIAKPATLFRNYPNPFSDQTTLIFSLPQTEEVNISIYSINGTKVKTLINQRLSAGQQTVEWKGDDHHNRKLTPGIYIALLRTAHYTKSIKVVVQ